MPTQTKKTWKEKEREISRDPSSLYNQFRDLVLQALYTCIVRDIVKEYRYRRAEKLRKYNAVTTFSHTALENYALLQLWKFFDKKNGTLHVYYVKDCIPKLKSWFDAKIKTLNSDINYICAWRHNFPGHRTPVSHFAPCEFEKNFAGVYGSEDRVKNFLLGFLCKINSEVNGTSEKEQMQVFQKCLCDYRKLVVSNRDEIFQKYDHTN